MEIGSFIKLNRIKQNMTQEQLAEGIVSESYLSKIENQRTIASSEVVNMLCARLDIQLHDEIDTRIKEMSRQWFDKLSLATDKEELRREYEELQEWIPRSYSDLQILFEIHKIRYFLVMDSLEQAQQQINSLKELSRNFDNVQQYYWLKFCGNYSSVIGDFKQALRFYKLAEEKTSQIELSEDERAEIKYMLGVTYSKQHKTLEVINYAGQALEVYRKTYNFRRCVHCHVLLGISYRRLKVLDKAIENYSLAHRLAAMNSDKELMNLTNINLGHLYSTIGNSGEAIKIFNEVLEEESVLSEEEKFNAIISLIKEYYLNEQFDEATEKVKTGLTFMEGKDTQRLKVFYYELKAYDNFLNNRKKEFEKIVTGELIPYLQKQKDHRNLILYCRMAGRHYESLHRYKKAAHYYEAANAAYEESIRMQP